MQRKDLIYVIVTVLLCICLAGYSSSKTTSYTDIYDEVSENFYYGVTVDASVFNLPVSYQELIEKGWKPCEEGTENLILDGYVKEYTFWENEWGHNIQVVFLNKTGGGCRIEDADGIGISPTNVQPEYGEPIYFALNGMTLYTKLDEMPDSFVNLERTFDVKDKQWCYYNDKKNGYNIGNITIRLEEDLNTIQAVSVSYYGRKQNPQQNAMGFTFLWVNINYLCNYSCKSRRISCM